MHDTQAPPPPPAGGHLGATRLPAVAPLTMPPAQPTGTASSTCMVPKGRVNVPAALPTGPPLTRRRRAGPPWRGGWCRRRATWQPAVRRQSMSWQRRVCRRAKKVAEDEAKRATRGRMTTVRPPRHSRGEWGVTDGGRWGGSLPDAHRARTLHSVPGSGGYAAQPQQAPFRCTWTDTEKWSDPIPTTFQSGCTFFFFDFHPQVNRKGDCHTQFRSDGPPAQPATVHTVARRSADPGTSKCAQILRRRWMNIRRVVTP